MAQSVKRVTFAQVMISRDPEFEPHVGPCADSLEAWSLEPALDYVPPYMSASSSLSLSLSLSLKNRIKH